MRNKLSLSLGDLFIGNLKLERMVGDVYGDYISVLDKSEKSA